MSDKTEQPTARRLERARREGDVPVSHAVMQAMGMLVALALVPAALSATAAESIDMLRASLASVDHATSPIPPQNVALVAVGLCGPLLLAVAAAVAVAGFVQTGGVFALKKVAPDLSRVSPLSLFRRIASPQRAFAILRAMVTVVVVAWLVVRRFEEHILDLARTAGRIDAAILAAGTLSLGIARDVMLVLMGLAVLDLVVTHRSWLARLKMTKAEVKREHRESEGDPELRAARDRAHQELMTAATIGAVRDATVVIVNPVRLANALRYREDEDEAPTLVAKGQGELARRMVEAAHAYGIPVVQDVTVARALSELTEGDAIPSGLYEAVAVILRDILEQTEGDGA
jgi:flagellar biosynthesis protein FlhB